MTATDITTGDAPSTVHYRPNGAEVHKWAGDGVERRVTFNAHGGLERQRWQVHGKMHRLDGPALIEYHPNGRVFTEGWYRDGYWDRVDGPAVTLYFPDGSLKSQEWRRDGRRHRVDGPVYRSFYLDGTLKGQSWAVNGVAHRSDGPAEVRYGPTGDIVTQKWVYQGQTLTGQQVRLVVEALDPGTSAVRVRELARMKAPAVRRAAILHPAYPKELRFLAELEHPEWF